MKEPIGKTDYFLMIKKDALIRAAHKLDAGPFKLFIYLADNMNDYRFNLSQIAVERSFGIKKHQFYTAVDKLIEAGYLYQPDPTKNNWVFDENGSDSNEVYGAEQAWEMP